MESLYIQSLHAHLAKQSYRLFIIPGKPPANEGEEEHGVFLYILQSHVRKYR
mgnify:CR=1 FL=1